MRVLLPRTDAPPRGTNGVCELRYPTGFEGAGTARRVIRHVVEIEHGDSAGNVEWQTWLRGEDGVVTVELMARDDVSLEVNNEVVLVPASDFASVQARLLLSEGWYQIRVRAPNHDPRIPVRVGLYGPDAREQIVDPNRLWCDASAVMAPGR